MSLKEASVFQKEHRLLEKCRELLDQDAVSPTTMRAMLIEMERAYRGLISDSEKITKVGDSIHRKLRNARNEIAAQNSQLKTLDEIAKAINREIEWADVLRVILEQGMRLLPKLFAGTVLVAESGNQYRAAVGQGPLCDRQSPAVLEDWLPSFEIWDTLLPGVFLVPEADMVAPPSRALCLDIGSEPMGRYLLLLFLETAGKCPQKELERIGRFREHAASAVMKAEVLTALRARNKELEETQRQLVLTEKMAAIGKLTSGLSHELLNPLNFINNFAEILCENLAELKGCMAADLKGETLLIMDDCEVSADRIRRHGLRAGGIVEKLSSYTRGAGGSPQAVDINELLDHYLRLVNEGPGYETLKEGLSLKRDFDFQLRKVWAAPRDLGCVFVQIIENAFDAMEKRRVLNGSRYAPSLDVSTRCRGDALEISFRDNGIGLDPTRAEQFIAPFFTTKGSTDGHAGLGLFICYTILYEGYRGGLEFHGEPGAFAEIKVRLPYQPADQARINLPRLGG